MEQYLITILGRNVFSEALQRFLLLRPLSIEESVMPYDFRVNTNGADTTSLWEKKPNGSIITAQSEQIDDIALKLSESVVSAILPDKLIEFSPLHKQRTMVRSHALSKLFAPMKKANQRSKSDPHLMKPGSTLSRSDCLQFESQITFEQFQSKFGVLGTFQAKSAWRKFNYAKKS